MSIFDDQIKTQLQGKTLGTHVLSFDVEGRTIHAQLNMAPRAKSLISFFHGAVDFKSRSLPVFINGFHSLKTTAHQLSISDPSLDIERNINVAWYAGEQTFDSTSYLHELILAVSNYLKATRRLYFGTSAGGYAALALSHRDPGSFVVVGNPQTSIAQYHLNYVVTRYREAAWPDMSHNVDLENTTGGNMARLYGDGFENTVIYVQNISDRRHFEGHMVPFVGALQNTENRDRLILSSEFWGTLGHVPTPREYLTWLTAICTTPSDSLEDILMTRHTIKQMSDVASARAPAKKSAPQTLFSDQDINIAKLLAPKT